MFLGYSPPLFYTKNDEKNLILVEKLGKMQCCDTIENELESNIFNDDSDFRNLKDGSYSNGIIRDFLPGIITGNASGDLTYYK